VGAVSGGAFRKDRPGAPDGFFRAEAAGLRWLAAAMPRGGAAVVPVLDVGDEHIELRAIEQVAPTRAAADDFGRALAVTHDAGAPAFGSPPDGWDGPCYIGRQPLPAGSFDRWGRFYAELRLRPFADAAHRIGTLGADGYAAVRAVCDRLENGDFDDDTPPARIHGDLWADNVVFGRDGVVLIDPAAHGGHRETDLAMLHLFGAPQLDRMLSAYAQAAGLDRTWQERIGLHQLHPLLVHAVTHGPSYGAEAAEVARRYG
jgi:fructosamine-3-kinase